MFQSRTERSADILPPWLDSLGALTARASHPNQKCPRYRPPLSLFFFFLPPSLPLPPSLHLPSSAVSILRHSPSRRFPTNTMARGNQRDKAREANQKKMAAQVRSSARRWSPGANTPTTTTTTTHDDQRLFDPEEIANTNINLVFFLPQ